MADTFVCPVCGFPGLDEPARTAPIGGGSYEFCPCCAFQFGFHDEVKGITDAQWRADWIAAGMPWRIAAYAVPDGWDPKAQLDALLAGGDPAAR